MRLLVEKFRQDKERTRSESKLRKLIGDVRGKHGVLLKSKWKRPVNITVYFSWYNYTPNGKKKFSQVKVNSGGGVRQKILPRSSDFNFCFQEAKNIYFPNQSNPVKGLLNNYCCELYSCNLQPLKETMENGEMFTLNSYMAYHNLKNARLNLVTRLRTLNDLNHEDVKVTQDYDFGIPEIKQYGKCKSKYLKPFSTKLDEKRYSQAYLKKLQTYYCFDMKTKI